MEPITDLLRSLTTLYAKNSVYYTTYTGSWIADVMYQFDYVALGKLLHQLLPVTEGMVFNFTDGFDGHNAFEDFVCGLLLQLFQDRQVIVKEAGISKIDFAVLDRILAECSTGLKQI